MRRTVIIGLGNPIVSDDGAGIAAARALAGRLKGRADVVVAERHAGGMRLMEAMVGFQRAVVVDAMRTGSRPPGTVARFSLEDLPSTGNTTSTHDTSLAVALEAGRALGLRLPDDITIWGVEAADLSTFSESLTPEVEAAMEGLVAAILDELGPDPECAREAAA